MYNCSYSAVLGYSSVSLLGIKPVVNAVWEESNPFGVSPGGGHVAYLGNSDFVRGG